MKKLLLFLLISFLTAGMTFANGKDDSASSDARELTIWEGLSEHISVTYPTLDDTPLYKEMQKRLNIDVTWIHPPQGQDNENFNLMIASNELPDIIYREWLGGYPGGPEKAISDGVILKHNDILKQYAPNYMSYVNTHPESAKQIKTDAGTMYGFNFFRSPDGDLDLTVFYGPQIRKDWLDDLGLDVPETIDDWEDVLTAFKESGKTDSPLGFTKIGLGRSVIDPANQGVFVQAFKTSYDFYIADSGEVRFGPLDPQFKDFLILFKDWYEKGLVDPEFISCERKAFDAKVVNGDIGAWVSFTNSGIGAYLDVMKNSPEPFDIAPTPYPVLKSGDVPFLGQMDALGRSEAMSITPQCDNIPLACEWLDYGYAGEGLELMNYGIEGESFNWVTDFPGFEGQRWPEYTDLIMDNPEGKTKAQMGYIYTRAFYSGPTIQQWPYLYQYAERPAQRKAIELWAEADAETHQLPPISATAEEAEDLATIMSEINTYREEMLIKFITGQEPLSNFGAFQDRLKKMNIERAIEIKQAGLDRYNAR